MKRFNYRKSKIFILITMVAIVWLIAFAIVSVVNREKVVDLKDDRDMIGQTPIYALDGNRNC